MSCCNQSVFLVHWTLSILKFLLSADFRMTFFFLLFKIFYHYCLFFFFPFSSFWGEKKNLRIPLVKVWRRQWHPTPVLLPGKSHGWRSLVGCSPWGRLESDTTERLHFHFSLSCIGEGNGNPLQYSCLENPRAGGAWWAAVYGESDTTEVTSQQRQQWKSIGGKCLSVFKFYRLLSFSKNDNTVLDW